MQHNLNSPPQPDPSDASPGQPLPELDRERLNALTTSASKVGACFGRDLTLSQADREQLLLVCAYTDQELAPYVASPEWQTFEALQQEGDQKGVLISFASHPGTNVPTWCIDGGDAAKVRKIRADGGRAAIEVPTLIYNTFHWRLTSDLVRKCADSSDEMLRGGSTKYLGGDLRQLGRFLKSR